MRALPLVLFGMFVPAVAFADATVPSRFELDGDTLKVPNLVYYETGKPTVLPASNPALDYVKQYLDANPAVTLLRIEVHSDAMGATEYNQRLTEQRALEVARQLAARGVACKRLLPVGFGKTKPIAANNTAEGRAQNRRTLFVIATLRGRTPNAPIDGGGKLAGDCCPH
jgi:OOP family OmpA-OmpF porin